jgi:hypothetical protein
VAVSEQLRAAEVEQGLPQPTGGRQAYQDEEGKIPHVVEGLGYPWPVLVEVKHAVALAYPITNTQAGDPSAAVAGAMRLGGWKRSTTLLAL